MADDVVKRFTEKEKQVAGRVVGQFHLPSGLVGGEFPSKAFEHDGAGLAEVLDGANPVLPFRTEQPDDVPHGADRFSGDALDALQLLGAPRPACSEISEHLDAAEVAADLVVQVAGDAFAHFEQLVVGVAAVADRQENQQKSPRQAEQRQSYQPGPAPTVDDLASLDPQGMAAGFNLQSPVQRGKPFASGNQLSIGPESIAERRTAPNPPAGGDHIVHSIGREHRFSEGDVLVLGQHLDLAQGEECRVIVESLPQLGSFNPDEAPATRLKGDRHRVVAGIAQHAFGDDRPLAGIACGSGFRDGNRQLAGKSKPARQVGGRSLGGQQADRIDHRRLAEVHGQRGWRGGFFPTL